MKYKFASLLPMAVLSLCASVRAQVTPPPLPIDVPAGVQVTLDMDARDDDLLAVVRQALGGGTGQTPINLNLSVLSRVGITTEDILKLLRNVHRVRAVAYRVDGAGDATTFQEANFVKEGFRRMVMAGGSDRLLVMRGERDAGMAVMYQHHGNITVVRMDGLIDMALLGRFVNAALTARLGGTPPAPKPAHKPAKKRDG